MNVTSSIGRKLLLWSLGSVASITALIAGWTILKAFQNPDVRSRRPGWLDDTAGFDVAFWSPLLVTVVIGGALVFFVLLRALRRIQDGEDLYAQRSGRGLRRRGERQIQDL